MSLVFVGKNLRLDLLDLLLGLSNLELMLVLNLVELINEVLRLGAGLEEMLSHVLVGATHLEDVGVEGRHVWLDMIEEEGLEEVGAVDFDVALLEHVLNGEATVSDFVLDQLVGDFKEIVEVKSNDGLLGEPEALDRVESDL